MFYDAKNIEQALIAKYFRYRILNEQEANGGSDVYPHLIQEREGLEQEFRLLEKRLPELGLTSNRTRRATTTQQQDPSNQADAKFALDRTIYLQVNWSPSQEMSEEVKNYLAGDFARLLNLSPESIEPGEFYPTAGVITMNASDDIILELIIRLLKNREVVQLTHISEDGTGQIKQVNVNKLTISTFDNYREGWVLVDNTYRLVSVKRELTRIIRSRQLEKARLLIKEARERSSFVLNLAGMALREFPTELWKLPHLRSLSLTKNDLLYLPDDISNLANLTSLKLGHNQLMTLPSAIAKLEKLTEIDLTATMVTELQPELAGWFDLPRFRRDPHLTRTNGSN